MSEKPTRDQQSESLTSKPELEPEPLVEGRDYTLENGLFVLTRDYLLSRGYCCGSGCRNCPYGKGSEPKRESKRGSRE